MHSLLRHQATSLEIRHEIARNSLKDLAQKFAQNKIQNKFDALVRMARDHAILALHAWNLHQNAPLFRQHMYLSSQLNLASLTADPTNSFNPQEHFSYALFSDHPETIQRFANLEVSAMPLDVQLLQLALTDDLFSLDKLISAPVANAGETQASFAAPLPQRNFYALLSRADKQALETDILAHAMDTFNKFEKKIHHSGDALIPVCALKAKLCRIKGISINIDHPMIPNELTRIAPLKHYEMPYKFLHHRHWSKQLLHKVTHWIPGRRKPSYR